MLKRSSNFADGASFICGSSRLFFPVMLSDLMRSFEVHSQGSLITQNGVETSFMVADVSAPFWIHHLKLTEHSAYTRGRSTWV
jgi:hypothetical protein